MNLKNSKYINPRNSILICFCWITFTSIPFLGFLRKYFLIIEALTLLPLLTKRISIGNSLKINRAFIVFITIIMVSALLTKSLFNMNLWMTLLLLYMIYMFTSTSKDEETYNLYNCLYIIMNIVTVISFIGILLVKLTDIEHSSIYLISYSMGNFIQEGRFLGILNSYNTLGPIAAIICFMAICNIKAKRKTTINSILFIINIYILIGTKSLTSYIGFAFGIAIMLLCSINNYRKTIFIVLLIIALLACILIVSQIDHLSNLLHRDLKTASYRTIIWDSCIKLMKEHPLTGYGSQERYLSAATQENLYIHPNGTHNMYMEILVLYGLPALLAFLSALCITIFRIIKCFIENINMNKTTILLPIMIFGFILIQNLMESQMLFARNPTMVIFLFSFIVLDRNLKTLIDSNLKIKDK